MAERVLFRESELFSETEEKELQALAIELSESKPLTPETAYLRARDSVGGEAFLRAKEELARLDKVDRVALRTLNDYEERVQRGAVLGRFLPNNAINLRRLYLEHQRARTAYNDSARRYEAKLLMLRNQENRAKIRGVAKELLQKDITQRVTLSEATKKISQVLTAEREKQELKNNVLQIQEAQSRRVMKQRV